MAIAHICGDGHLLPVQDGMRWGKGFMVYADGDTYEGSWRENKADGPGSYVEADGTKYQGYWQGTYLPPANGSIPFGNLMCTSHVCCGGGVAKVARGMEQELCVGQTEGGTTASGETTSVVEMVAWYSPWATSLMVTGEMTSATDGASIFIGTTVSVTMATTATVPPASIIDGLVFPPPSLTTSFLSRATDKRHGSDGVLVTDTHYTGGDRLLVEYKEGALQRYTCTGFRLR
jgi:hypothetical protein